MKTVNETISSVVLVTVFFCAESLALGKEVEGSTSRGELAVGGRVVAMEGACNALRCPVIVYKIETSRIFTNSLFPEKSDYELAAFSVCGESGLKLGVEYRFSFRLVQSELVSDFDRPVGADGRYLSCDMYFESTPVVLVGDAP